MHLKYKVRGAKLMYSRGQRPSVRGTVKNPNDHPHGGRTRSISRPQTPWGFARNTSRKSKVVE
jgi:ribosomal protein L2